MILTADWHLRSSVPRCRTETEEEWYKTQKRILEFIYSFKEPVYIAGDIFHHYNPGNRILDLFLSFALHNETHIMMGNHDARNGILDPDSGYGVLKRIVDAGHPYLKNMEPFAWIDFNGETTQGDDNGILFLHTLCFSSNSAAPAMGNYTTAKELAELHDTFSFIVVGDNHTSFLYNKWGKTVVGPGCITKQAVDFKNKELSIFRIDMENWSIGNGLAPIEKIVVPDIAELVDDRYIIAEHEREDRYNTLVKSLKVHNEMTFDFKSNVWASAKVNATSDNCIKILEEVIPQ